MATEEDKTTEQEEEETTTLSSSSLAALAPQTFSLEDITETYNLLANQPQNYADALMQRQGTAQASYGPLAEQAMGQSRTPQGGVGNYTYNRLIRPSVDTMRDEMIVKGLSDALNKQISDSLKKAQNEYNKKKSKGSSGGSSSNDKTDDDSTKINGSEDVSTGGGGYTGPKRALARKYQLEQVDPETGAISTKTYPQPEWMDDLTWMKMIDQIEKNLNSNERLTPVYESK